MTALPLALRSSLRSAMTLEGVGGGAGAAGAGSRVTWMAAWERTVKAPPSPPAEAGPVALPPERLKPGAVRSGASEARLEEEPPRSCPAGPQAGISRSAAIQPAPLRHATVHLRDHPASRSMTAEANCYGDVARPGGGSGAEDLDFVEIEDQVLDGHPGGGLHRDRQVSPGPPSSPAAAHHAV